jgi:hypothetical protein
VNTADLRSLLVAALASGCGASVTVSGPSADAGVAPADTSTTLPDAGVAPDDAPTTAFDAGVAPIDVGSRRDVPPTTPDDVPAAVRDVPARDRPAPVDAPLVDASTLAGTWRAVRYEAPDPDRGEVVLTDVDTLFPMPDGGRSPFRVNGVMSLSETRLALTLATLSDGHFYPYTPTGAAGFGWSGVGYTLPGLLTATTAGAVFEIPGGDGRFRFERTADDALVLVDDDSGTRTTFVRDPRPAEAARVNAFAVVFQADPAGAYVAPRAALRWDLPGAEVARTADTALLFRAGAPYATVAVTLPAGPPAAFIAPVGDVSIAAAFLEAYDDANRNDRYDPGVDRLLGESPIGIAWRGGERTTEAFTRSAFADVVPGWQVVHLHRDYVTGRWAATRYDNTRAPSPDAYLRAGFTPTGIDLR